MPEQTNRAHEHASATDGHWPLSRRHGHCPWQQLRRQLGPQPTLQLYNMPPRNPTPSAKGSRHSVWQTTTPAAHTAGPRAWLSAPCLIHRPSIPPPHPSLLGPVGSHGPHCPVTNPASTNQAQAVAYASTSSHQPEPSPSPHQPEPSPSPHQPEPSPSPGHTAMVPRIYSDLPLCLLTPARSVPPKCT